MIAVCLSKGFCFSSETTEPKLLHCNYLNLQVHIFGDSLNISTFFFFLKNTMQTIKMCIFETSKLCLLHHLSSDSLPPPSLTYWLFLPFRLVPLNISLPALKIKRPSDANVSWGQITQSSYLVQKFFDHKEVTNTLLNINNSSVKALMTVITHTFCHLFCVCLYWMSQCYCPAVVALRTYAITFGSYNTLIVNNAAVSVFRLLLFQNWCSPFKYSCLHIKTQYMREQLV